MTVEQAAQWFEERAELTPPLPGWRESFRLAGAALREKAERENPRPLTPEELRGMIGEPVWTVGVYLDGDTWAGWDIVDGFDDDGVTFGYSTEKPEWWAYDLRDQDGRLFGCAWIAYRHKPKEVP